MKITKRIAKEVHNEKVKSFDEGRQKALKEELEFYEFLESSDEEDIEVLFSKRIAKIKKELGR